MIINNYLRKSQTIINNHKIIKHSQRWYLFGRTSGGFCDVDLHFVAVVILHLPMFFIHIFFSTSSLTLPWTITRLLDPFCTFSPAHRRVIRNTFIFQPFCYLLTASAMVLSGHFLPTGVFYLMLLPDVFGTFPTFWHNMLLSRFHWIHSNPQYFIHLKSVFMQVNIAKVLLVVKTLIRSAATLLHENIKQQPN